MEIWTYGKSTCLFSFRKVRPVFRRVTRVYRGAPALVGQDSNPYRALGWAGVSWGELGWATPCSLSRGSGVLSAVTFRQACFSSSVGKVTSTQLLPLYPVINLLVLPLLPGELTSEKDGGLEKPRMWSVWKSELGEQGLISLTVEFITFYQSTAGQGSCWLTGAAGPRCLQSHSLRAGDCLRQGWPLGRIASFESWLLVGELHSTQMTFRLWTMVTRVEGRARVFLIQRWDILLLNKTHVFQVQELVQCPWVGAIWNVE